MLNEGILLVNTYCTAKISKIRIKTISARSNRTDGEKTGAGGQHRRVGHVDISPHLRAVQRHLLDTLQVTAARGFTASNIVSHK